jgi:hypothetical protein
MNSIHRSWMPWSSHMSSHRAYNCCGHRYIHMCVLDNMMWHSCHSTEWPTIKIHLILSNMMSTPQCHMQQVENFIFMYTCTLITMTGTYRCYLFYVCHSHKHTELACLWQGKKMHDRAAGNPASACQNLQILSSCQWSPRQNNSSKIPMTRSVTPVQLSYQTSIHCLTISHIIPTKCITININI